MATCGTTVKFPVFIDCNGISQSQISLGYQSYSNKGEITISTSETPAIIPLASNIIAGLMSPAQFALLSSTDISTTVSSSTSSISISGNTKYGTVQIAVGVDGQSGTVFVYDISTYIPNNSILVFSDMLDNYAMGHYQVGYLYIDNLKRMVFKVKDGITLEPSTIYKWSYKIN